MSLTTSHFVPFDREDVWDWHTRTGAVVRLSPPFAPMTPVREASRLSDGTTVFSLPAGLKWVARHDLSGYRRGHRFTDVCVSAPLRALANWRHVHTFADAPGGTVITDEVTTRVPGSTLTGLFAYRQHQLFEDLKFLARLSAHTPGDLRDDDGNPRRLTIAVTGSGGTVGRALCAQLGTAGHTVIRLRRGNVDDREDTRAWNPSDPDPDLLRGVDVLVHLAGEPLLGRFTEGHKRSIRESRTAPTRYLAELVAASPTCRTMICASAIGFYGHDRGDEVLTDVSAPGEGFLAEVCRDWERACQPATDAGKRVANIRTGIVLAGTGGVLPLLKMLFSAGLGGKFGDGSIWFSWISIDDLTDIYCRAIVDPALSGPINATAPNPVRNAEMTEALASELNRPAFLQIPTLGPKLLLGSEGAEQIALANQRVAPTILESLEHTFRHPTIDVALAHELGGEELLGSTGTAP
ncbi:TIGR01777 family oxidoreductase [Corynebacterium sp. CCM 8835]|uniref:TIGR01777 family oxidoreductase n=1 Tax=Corynebacterium antarcticum TaxID=2800405 RepID=A0ABS1FKS6_9CORY|nr:TIGR01777 family oxidoreductase [Corynebacterium antarcticum]MCK7641495.1 TIGR01777 family oxidoreductase [Corynebacterium antarcticum]MCL0244723.1 TIGR01777 family oxidoreductase [Corynebacterium antarcticum]MCX7491096.1 TIGR01777 family oxidoreductase [Corynebacterium antarcticum]MCX7539721.1 TIGR01777 family oxidoreductase [Corynebacterium antarcticum]